MKGTRPIAIEAFCGPGGLSLGVARAGFEVALSFDIDQQAIRTIAHNQKHTAVVMDASATTGSSLRRLAKMDDSDLDLFCGGPPCQGFSKQKRGAHLGDNRNQLVLEYLRLVKELAPKFFLLENVAIFGQKRGRLYLREIEEQLAGSYTIYSKFLNSADYGLAQTRQRFFLVGKRSDVRSAFHFPAPTVHRWKTVGDVLKGLPEPPEDYSVPADYPNHQRARVTAINIERFSHVPQGGGWQQIPMELRLPCHKRANRKTGGWPDVYGRLDWNGQCPTITGGFDSFTRGRYGHPLHDRPLTPMEAALLQGFPRGYKFFGTRGDIRSQIGNAVPPPLGEAVAKSIALALRGAVKSPQGGTGRQLQLPEFSKIK